MDLKEIILKNVKKQCINILDNKVDKVYEISQERVPVRTGNLKDSWNEGFVEISNNIVSKEFEYTESYAKKVDDKTKFLTDAIKEVF